MEVNYNGLQLLNDIKEMNEIQKIKIICYKINKTQNIPYLSFLLIKDLLTDEFIIPSINYLFNKEQMEAIILCEIFNYFPNLDLDFENVLLKGFLKYKNENYVFMDISNIQLNNDLLFKNDKTWMILPDEIINKKNVCNISISQNCIDFFLNNNDFLFLHDINNIQLENPVVVYHGTHEKQLYFNYSIHVKI